MTGHVARATRRRSRGTDGGEGPSRPARARADPHEEEERREYADIQEHVRITAGKLTAGELTLDAALKEIDAGVNKVLGK